MNAKHVFGAAGWGLLSAVATWLGVDSPATAAAYKFTRIDFPGADLTIANGINNAGQIVGAFGPGLGSFLKTGRSFTRIDISGASSTIANGINGSGQIVGGFVDSTGRGFLKSGGLITPLDAPSGFGTVANGINASGQIVGDLFNVASDRHGFLYSGGSFTPIDVPGSFTTDASGINDAGQIVGSFSDTVGNQHGFLRIGSGFTQLDMPGANFTAAHGINNRGQIVGEFSSTGLDTRGFVDSGGKFTQLQVPGSSQTVANGVNDKGQIAGWFSDSNGTHGFLATPGGSVSGDPNFTTYDGLTYRFQGRGDFVLVRSTVAGDQFDVQIRTETWPEFPWRSIVSEAAATLCGHRASIDVDRSGAGDSLLWVDGRPSSLSAGNPVLKLGGCEITERSASSWEAVWDTGEILDITNNPRNFLNLSSWYSPFLGPNSVEGLLTSSDKPDTWRIDGSSLLDAAVLEPSTLPLLAVGLAGLLIIRRRAMPSAIA